MPLTIDRLLAGKWSIPAWVDEGEKEDLRRLAEYIREDAAGATVVRADNVAEYMYAQSDREDWEDAFPSLAPPFPCFWIEYRLPRHSLSEGRLLEQYQGSPIRNAVFIRAQKVNDNAHLLACARKIQSRYPKEGRGFLLAHGGWGWIMEALSFLDTDGLVTGPLLYGQLVLSEKGQNIVPPHYQIPGYRGSDSRVLGACVEFVKAFLPAFLTISFLHCKNVKLASESAAPKLARAYERRHGRPLVKYHTLEITPMKEILRREGQSETLGLKRALHICRGHFATYSEDRPLFGRVAGTIWKPMHVRGTVGQGVVIKDYRVNKPEPTE